MNKFKWFWSQDYLFSYIKKVIKVFQRYNFLYRIFKINRKCYCCGCRDCQETELRSEWWYCPHLKNNICEVCCIYDSLGTNCNWKECKTCPEEWKRVDITDKKRMKELGWKEVKRVPKIKKLVFGDHLK